jgi:hypothetical protein
MDMVCSGTVVDHVDQKTWILTSASLVRKPDTLFEAYEPYDVKVSTTTALLLVCSCWLSPLLQWIISCKFIDCRFKWPCTINDLLKGL